MHIHCTHVSRIIFSPDQSEQIFPAVYFIFIFHKKFQQIKFFCGKVYFPAWNKQPSAVTVQTQIPFLHNRRNFFLFSRSCGTTHDRFDTRFHLKNIKRLCDIVIGTIIESQNLIHIVALRCQHNNRHIRKFTNRLTYFESVHLRKHDVQKDHIILVGFRHIQRFFSIVCTIHFHPVLFKTEPDSFYD